MLFGLIRDVLRSAFSGKKPADTLAKHYVELLKKSLLNELYLENEARLIYTFKQMQADEPLAFGDYFDINTTASGIVESLRVCKQTGERVIFHDHDAGGMVREVVEIRNITELSHTMIGRKRLDNIQQCVETVLSENIRGDFIETGIWRGGACIFMRGMLMAHGIEDRLVWAADSFEGVPPPTRREDEGFDISASVLPILAVSLEEVKELFSRYGLLDEKVRFLKGWFKDTLTTSAIKQLAILRLDGDLYESTMDALVPLYDKVSRGGFVIVDDYESCPPCKHAVNDFRAQRGISDAMHVIDAHSVYWRKS